MIIKDKKKKFFFNFNIFFRIYFFLSIIIVIGTLLIFFNSGLWIVNKNKILDKIYSSGVNHYLSLPIILSNSLTSYFNKLEEINLNISYLDLVELEKERNKILDSSIYKIRDQDFLFNEVNVKMNFEDKELSGKLRLKGDRIVHFEKNKSSYKISTKNEEEIFGIRSFSLIKPRARNYIHEWLFHEFSSEGGLIKLLYKFINLRINGEAQGLYVFEENFDKNLIERNSRRNGPIFSLKEEFSNFAHDTELEIYNKKFWNSEENTYLAEVAYIKLKNFFEGKLKAKEALDLEKWFWFFSVTDLTFTHHGLSPRNVKFYFNPLSGLFEPIPYDGHRTIPNYNNHIIEYYNKSAFDIATECLKNKEKCLEANNEAGIFLINFFFDENKNLINENYELYQKAIFKITEHRYLDNFFAKRSKEINFINSKIYSDYYLIDRLSNYGPGLYFFSEEDLYYRAKLLRNKFKNKISKISITENKDYIKISNNDLNNLSLFPLELNCEIQKNGNKFKITKSLNNKKKFDSSNQILINKKTLFEDLTKCSSINFYNQIDNSFLSQEITYIDNNNSFKKLNSNLFSFTSFFNIKNKNLLLKSDVSIIDRDVYIPPNFIVKVLPGQKIILKNSAIIFSESPWIVGNLNEPKVYFGGERSEFGGGLIVKSKKKEKSIFTNVTFSYLKGSKNRFIYENEFPKLIKILKDEKNNFKAISLSKDARSYTALEEHNYLGAINFYNSNVEIINCDFLDNYSEDAINIISSEFKITNSFFQTIYSDSIDIDFSEGEIRDLVIKNSGNDGIDFSGSNVFLENININNTGDKSISVGENSRVNLKNIQIKNSYVGIASKDGSLTNSKEILITDTKFPFASYRKKSAYDYAKLVVEGPYQISNFVQASLRDKNSKIILDNKEIKKFNKKIYEIIYEKNLKLISEKYD